MNAILDEGSAIVGRMRELRSTGQSDVIQLHAQAERVTDWREHVRAQPIVSVVSSAAIGYMVVRALAGDVANSTKHSSSGFQPVNTSSPPQVAKQVSLSAGLLSLAGGIALSVGRQWVTEYLKKQLGVNAYAIHQSPNPEQRSTTRA